MASAEPRPRNYGTFPYLPLPDVRRVRSYFNRLPLATKGLLLVISGLYFATLIWPGLKTWGALIPNEIGIHTLYRLNTYPLLHWSFVHYILNIIAVIPLLERFELEYGTIITFLLFTGPFGLLPGGIYTVISRYIFHNNTAAVGASVWVFLLLSAEAIGMFRKNPHFTIGDVNIPTWTSPLFLMLFIHFLVPHTSLLGHLSGAVVGYLWGLGYIKFLAPPDKILKFIEDKLDLLRRLPWFVSVDQKTYGRYGVLPTSRASTGGPGRTLGMVNGVAIGPLGSTQRLGP